MGWILCKEGGAPKNKTRGARLSVKINGDICS